jgi:hypothetical protein
VSVALDTMVLIWGGLRKVNPRSGSHGAHDADMERRSRILLRDLDEKKETVIVPVVTIAELLAPMDPNDHGAFIAAIQERFFCPPFDIRAASLAAKLWRYNRGLPSAEQISRTVLKADVLIIASVKVGGASVFYSHDANCRKLASHAGLVAKDLPTHSEDLFTNAEINQEFGTTPKASAKPQQRRKKS